MTVSREEVITKLITLPGILEKRRRALLQMQGEADAAKRELVEVEYDLLIRTQPDGTPVIDGKNESVRKHQLREKTLIQHREIQNAEAILAGQRILLQSAEDEFACYRALARLFAGTVEI